jgi:hypothetical protein
LAKNLKHLATSKTNPNLAERGGKTRWAKKVKDQSVNCMEKLKK